MGGLDVAVVTGVQAIATIDEAIARRTALHVAFVNAHCVNVAGESAAYRAAMGGMLCLADGVGVDMGSRLLYGEPFPENLNGTDFVPRFLAKTRHSLRVGLVGGQADIAERAATAFAERFPAHRFLAVSDGFFAPETGTAPVLEWLRLARLDVVLIAMGVPRQELFIAEHITAREAPVAFAVGALLDFTAGKVVRAPALVRRLRAEWLWRLACEPRRLARRYITGNPAFLFRMTRQKLDR